MDSKYPIANFATSVGVRPLAASISDGNTTFDLPSLPAGLFKVGEQLVVNNRFKATVPLNKDPDFTCDFQVGAEAFLTDVALLETDAKVTVRMSKIIRDRLVNCHVEARVDNLVHPSALPAPQPAEKINADNQGAPIQTPPVSDAAPAWTNRVKKA